MSSYSYSDMKEGEDPENSAKEPLPVYEETQETQLERNSCKCLGGSCFVVLAVLVFTWSVHAAPLSWVSDAPAFARSLLLLSVAHHTDEWKDHVDSLPPPPPSFGDGRGNF